jgi:hypothetical protein
MKVDWRDDNQLYKRVTVRDCWVVQKRACIKEYRGALLTHMTETEQPKGLLKWQVMPMGNHKKTLPDNFKIPQWG